jgi:hypothetical protein
MKCIFIKPNGDQCEANAMTQSDYCYLHNPEISQEDKQLAKVKGGKARALVVKTELPELPLKTPNDTVTLMADTISRVRAGEMDIRVANCLGFLTDKLLKAFEVSRLNDKVEFIERIILEKRTI